MAAGEVGRMYEIECADCHCAEQLRTASQRDAEAHWREEGWKKYRDRGWVCGWCNGTLEPLPEPQHPTDWYP